MKLFEFKSNAISFISILLSMGKVPGVNELIVSHSILFSGTIGETGKDYACNVSIT